MRTFQVHNSKDAEEIYTGKHVELIVVEVASTETAQLITKKENCLLSH